MEQDLKTLQLFYASALADSVYHYNNAGILSMVTEKKAGQQALTAASQLKQLRINTPEQLFELFSRIFGCIQWNVKTISDEVIATGNHCLLYNLAKKNANRTTLFYLLHKPFESHGKSNGAVL
jgi:hypothetical protein